MRESRKEIERHFFDKTFELESRRSVSKFYRVVQSSRDYYKEYLIRNCRNKEVIEYGCGKGSYAFILADHALKVVGIDISEVAIKIAKAKAKEDNLDNIVFLNQDAEAMKFENSSYDVIFGTGILHHLHLDKAMSEIVRVLRPEGRAIFIEPLGHNPLINLFRKLTPQLRTEDEHPLTNDDLKFIEEFFYQKSHKFYHLFSLLAVPFRKYRMFPLFLKLLDNLDDKIFKWLPFSKLMAWQVVIILEKPKKLLFR